ncbi:MAG: polyprenyl synthetase family protein [Actinobacteria bacterium]|nr:polyprenyl synthetase family protein [Actinomycetota bacterium]
MTASAQPRPSLGASHADFLRAVEAALAVRLDKLSHEFQDYAPESPALGGEDLVSLLRTQVQSGGKRLRPTMARLGWCYAGAPAGTESDLVRLGAALEMLHVFTLVQDDVMDRSDRRRGLATVHVQVAASHGEAGARGDAQQFGDSIAVLVGDLAHAAAEHMAAALPTAVHRLWRAMVMELVAGQALDLAGAADRRRDLPHARRVAAVKSGAYSIQRPLTLGATLAGALPEDVAALHVYGDHVGRAFALRDDILGIWGDPAVTGKPAGDDLVDGKPTVLLALAHERVTGPDRALLDRVTAGAIGPDEVPAVMDVLDTSGVRLEAERMIHMEVEAALAALDRPDAAGDLAEIAHRIGWRTQ